MKRFAISFFLTAALAATRVTSAEDLPDLAAAPFSSTWRTSIPNSTKRPWSQKITSLSNATNVSILGAAEAPSVLFLPDHSFSNRFYFCAELTAPPSRQSGWFGLAANFLGNGPSYRLQVRPNPLGSGPDGIQLLSQFKNKTDVLFSSTLDLPDRKRFFLEWIRYDSSNVSVRVYAEGKSIFNKSVLIPPEPFTGFPGLLNQSASQSSNEWRRVWISKELPSQSPALIASEKKIESAFANTSRTNETNRAGLLTNTGQTHTNRVLSNAVSSPPQLVAWERRGSSRSAANDTWTLDFDRALGDKSVALLFKRKGAVFLSVSNKKSEGPDTQASFVSIPFPDWLPRSDYEIHWNQGDSAGGKLSDFAYRESPPKAPSLVFYSSPSNQGFSLGSRKTLLERDPREFISTSTPTGFLKTIPPPKSDWILIDYPRFETDAISEDPEKSFPDLDDSVEEWCRLHPETYFALKLPAPESRNTDTATHRLRLLSRHLSQKAYASRHLGFVFEWRPGLSPELFSLFAESLRDGKRQNLLLGIACRDLPALLPFARHPDLRIFLIPTGSVRTKAYPSQDLNDASLSLLRRDKLVFLADASPFTEKNPNDRVLSLSLEPLWNRDEFIFAVLRREIGAGVLSGFPNEPKAIESFVEEILAFIPAKKETKTREAGRAKRLLQFALGQKAETSPEVTLVLDGDSADGARSNQWALNRAGLSWKAGLPDDLPASPVLLFQSPPSEDSGRAILENALGRTNQQLFIICSGASVSNTNERSLLKINNLRFYVTERSFLTPVELNQIYREAGLRPFLSTGDEIVSQGPWVLLHTRESGTKECLVPRDWKEVTDLFTGRVYPVVDGKFECHILAPATCLFFKGQWKDNAYVSRP